MAISQDYIAELLARSDTTEIIGNFVQLKRRGRTHTGLCPFHNEKTPSFVVYPETQSFYCFGCGAGGDIITFIKKIQNLDYVEAVKWLAARAGMPLPEENDETGKRRSRILAINKETARFFYAQLNSEWGAEARAYWRGRGLSDHTIRKFGLGYAPNDFHALRDYLRKSGYHDEEMIEAAVVKRSERGNVYDVFRNRVMIPVFDLRGNVIAFGGRNMGPEKPKYINSPETLVYKKGRTMFAMNLAKKSTEKRFVLCEGYLDVISLHQAGFDTAVAGCGTALTPEQVKLISEYANEVVLCYDIDEAGQKAAKRAIQLFENAPVKISVLKVTDAKDPDEYIKKFGKERFSMLLNGSANAIEYALSNAKAKHDLSNLQGRLDYIRDGVEILAGKVTATERDVYAGRLAQETDIEKRAIVDQINQRTKRRYYSERKQREKDLLKEGVSANVKLPYGRTDSKALGVAHACQQLIAALMKNTAFYNQIIPRLKKESFLEENMAQVYELICKRIENGESIELAALSGEIPEQTMALLSRILAQNYDVGFSEQDVEMYLRRIEESEPASARAGELSGDDLQRYLDTLREQKE